MMFFKRKPKTKWVFVDRVVAYSNDHEGKDIVGWAEINLYADSIDPLNRRYEMFGQWTYSPRAIRIRAQVDAWINGGPIPNSMEYVNPTPPPKPRKDLPAKKRKEPKSAGNVVPFKSVA